MAAKDIKINICDWLNTLVSVASPTVVSLEKGQKLTLETDGKKTWLDKKLDRIFITKNKKSQSS